MCIFSHNLKLNENPNLLYCFVAWGNMWNVISFIWFFCLFGFGCNCNVQFGMNESCVQPLGFLAFASHHMPEVLLMYLSVLFNWDD
jgi:hypothetical protein